MLFNSAVFVAFLLLTFVTYWSLPSNRVRHWFLILASLVFYGWWDYRFTFLIAYVTLVAYGAAQALERWPARRTLWVRAAVVLQLAQLAVFKYTNFALGTLEDAAAAVGLHLSIAEASILLPIGISFYTFHGISYVVDVYGGKLKQAQSLRVVALYIVFFPQLVAGPIVRADSFIPQLFERRTLSNRDVIVGLKFVVMGLVYKGIFADRLAPLVDAIFKSPRAYDNMTLLTGSLGFYAQIYFDFVGYSTMAIGISRLFGFKLPKNFDYPYRATSITDFWRRWHISLSTWLRDYLYIPLGGNRHGVGKQYRNLILTMLLGGLWHGASYNFVLWGGLHGIGLALHKLWASWFPKARSLAVTLPRTLLAWALTQLFVLAAWVPFRANSFWDTQLIFKAMLFQRADGALKHAPIPWLLLLLPLLADHALTYNPWLKRVHWPARPVLVVAIVGACLALALPLVEMDVQNFIYFQF